jgi:long-chain acyl-CoA synthetase
MLSDIITAGVQRYPDNVALIYQDALISYADLAVAVDRLADGLGELGIEPGQRVALLLPNCPPFVYGYYACAALGAVVVPVNPLLKAAELEYIWADADVRLVITIPQLLPVVEAARKTLPDLRHVVCTAGRADLPDPAAADAIEGFATLSDLMEAGAHAMADGVSPAFDLERGRGRHENDCAVVIYTSGTTGRPKGAMLSHRNLTRNVEQVRARLYFTEADRFLTLLPLFHAFAATVCMNTCLAAGCASLLMESFVPARTLEAIRRHGITVFPAVPAIFNALLMTARSPEELAPIRFFVSGGAPLPVATLEALESRFHIPVLEGDGPTECSPVTTVNPMEGGPRKPGSVGTAVPGVEVAIFDDDDRPQPTDTVGEIVVRGDNVMLGYLNQPEATAEVMKSGWYHTGDLGKIDSDGYVYIVDRKKDMVITSGLNVYPREVEEALFTHPAVQDAAVIGLPDPLRGEQVVAVVVRKPDVEVTERDLLRHCREVLANYKVPQKVIFQDALPRGGTGKVLKRLLKKELEMAVDERQA